MKLIGANINNDEEIIAENERWFKFFVLLPVIVTMFFATACLVLGFILAVEIDMIFLLIFWGGGGVFCALTYAFLRIVLCYKILHIYYLKELVNNSVSENYEDYEEPEELPEI